jgi:hypothetical protein
LEANRLFLSVPPTASDRTFIDAIPLPIPFRRTIAAPLAAEKSSISSLNSAPMPLQPSCSLNGPSFSGQPAINRSAIKM